MKQKEKQGMNNYIGQSGANCDSLQYRVRTPIDYNGEFTDNFDDTYIKGRRGIELFRYSDTLLAIYIPNKTITRNVYNQLKQYLTPQTIEQLETDISDNNMGNEYILYFEEKYFQDPQINKLFKETLNLETQGSKIPPRSIKNLPRDKQKYIPQDEDNYIVLKDSISSIVSGFVFDHQIKHSPAYYIKIYQYIMQELNINNVSPAKTLIYLDENKLLENAIKIVNKLSENTTEINKILTENKVVDFSDVITGES